MFIIYAVDSARRYVSAMDMGAVLLIEFWAVHKFACGPSRQLVRRSDPVVIGCKADIDRTP